MPVVAGEFFRAFVFAAFNHSLSIRNAMTTLLQDILAHNRAVTEKEGEARRAAAVALEKTPHRRCAIFTCMDARLVEMVEPALGIRRG